MERKQYLDQIKELVQTVQMLLDANIALGNKQKELGWEPSLQFEEGIEETVKWYLVNQEWMDHVTSGEYQKYYENMYGK